MRQLLSCIEVTTHDVGMSFRRWWSEYRVAITITSTTHCVQLSKSFCPSLDTKPSAPPLPKPSNKSNVLNQLCAREALCDMAARRMSHPLSDLLALCGVDLCITEYGHDCQPSFPSLEWHAVLRTLPLQIPCLYTILAKPPDTALTTPTPADAAQHYKAAIQNDGHVAH